MGRLIFKEVRNWRSKDKGRHDLLSTISGAPRLALQGSVVGLADRQDFGFLDLREGQMRSRIAGGVMVIGFFHGEIRLR